MLTPAIYFSLAALETHLRTGTYVSLGIDHTRSLFFLREDDVAYTDERVGHILFRATAHERIQEWRGAHVDLVELEAFLARHGFAPITERWRAEAEAAQSPYLLAPYVAAANEGRLQVIG